MPDEGALDAVQIRSGALDGLDRGAVDRGGQCETTQHPFPVDGHRAGTAQPVIAALLGSGEAEPFAQQVQQCGADIGAQLLWCAIDGQV